MTTQSYNTDLLMQVREKIVTEPGRHFQGHWAMADDDPRQGGDCGTSYCVAGWTTVLDGQQLLWERAGIQSWGAEFLADDETTIAHYAREALGLSRPEANALFAAGNPRGGVLVMLDRLIEAGKNGVRVERLDPL